MSKITFILALVLLVVAVLYWKSCHKSTLLIPTQSDKTVDSIVNKAISDSVKLNHVIDSLQDDYVLLELQNDSLTSEINISKSDLHSKGIDILNLIDKYDKAKDSKDSSLALNNCDSLIKEVLQAKGIVTGYENQNDSLGRLTAKIIANKDTVIGRLSSAFNEANAQLFETSRQYGIISDNYKKSLKKSGKKWGIGPVGGYGISGTGVGPYFGIGVTYNLFKF